MSDHTTGSSMTDRLSKPTSIFGLRLIVVLGVAAGAAFVLLLFLLSLWIISRRSHKSKSKLLNPNSKTRSTSNQPQSAASTGGGSNYTIPPVCKQIQVDVPNSVPDSKQLLLSKKHQQKNGDEEREISSTSGSSPFGIGYKRIQIEIGKDHRIFYPEKCSSESRSGEHLGSGNGSNGGSGCGVPEVSHLGWGHWYTLRELEEATNGLADENVIGSGGYGIVYHGVLQDGSQIAVKNLLNNKY